MALDPQALVVPLNKGKMALMALGSAAVVAIAVLMYLDADGSLRGLLGKLVAGASVVFFSICTIYLARKLFDSAPGLVIDAQGIVDNSSGISAGRIPWSEITGSKITAMGRQRFLTIQVRNSRKYVERTSGLKRHLVEMNAKFFGGPIHINSNMLRMPLDELLKLINEARAKYHGA